MSDKVLGQLGQALGSDPAGEQVFAIPGASGANAGGGQRPLPLPGALDVTSGDAAFAYLVERLAERFPEVDVVLLRKASALRRAFEEALVSMDVDAFVDRLVKRGPLRGAANPYGALVWRARHIVADVDERARIAADAVERRRARQLTAAARFGERLADLVVTGDLDREGAELRVLASYPDLDVAAIAFAALKGDSL